MNLEHSINFQSLNVVRDELIATIEASARELENFVDSQQEDVDALQASINGVQQICGILKVLELDSAALLAEELLTVANAISPGASGPRFTRSLEVISNTFFVLPRYLEYLEQSQRQLPVVLIPHINALRKLHDEVALLESHFCTVPVPDQIHLPDIEKLEVEEANFRKELRRARNLYQLGLTGLLREKSVTNAVALMRRGTKRLLRISGKDASISALWFVTDLALEALSSQSMALLETRKYLFMRLDRVIRQVELGGAKSMQSEPPKSLMKELLYLLALSDHKSQRISSLTSALNAIRLPYTEAELQKEYATLYGPSSHTIASLAHVLNTEVGSAKRILENAAHDAVSQIDDIEGFLSLIKNIAEILNVVGLGQASNSLKTQVAVVQGWSEDGGAISPDGMSEVANTLLYIESLIQDLQSNSLDSGQSNPDRLSQDAKIASKELATAITIVKEECLGGLSLAKRALNSFADSQYDSGHIRNISKTLNTIRGAMLLLKKDRVARVLDSSAEFVDEVLMSNELPAAINEVLETFADVIIAVEYFFDSADNILNADENVLKVAEESLVALGYELP